MNHDEYSNFENMSYKELQLRSKQIGIPANMRRQILVDALVANQNGHFSLVQRIVELHKSIRKDKLSNKPQNLSVSKKKKAKNKSKAKDETVVDSTSQDIKDTVSFNCDISSINSAFSDSKKAACNLAICPLDHSSNKIFVNPTQQYQSVSEFSQWDLGNNSNDFHNGSEVTNYSNNAADFRTPATFSTPFSSQNAAQHYQQTDLSSSSLSHYNCGELHHSSLYRQQTPHNCDLIGTNLNYNSGIGNYHQLPNVSKHSSIPMSSSTTSSKSSLVCPIPRSNYYCKASNNTTSQMDVITHSSPYLPNIPQLADVAVDSIPTNNVSLTWTEDPLAGIESERFGKYSPEETLGLDADFADMLDISKVDLGKSNVFPSSENDNAEASFQNDTNLDHFYSAPGNQNSSMEAMNGSKFSFPNMTVTYSQNCSNQTSFGSSNGNSFCFENTNLAAPQTSLGPLPPISTLFYGINQSNLHSDVQTSNWPTFSEGSFRTDSTSASFTSESSNIADPKDDQNCINLVTPSSSPEKKNNRISILRNRLQINQLSNSTSVPPNRNGLMVGTTTSLNHVTEQLALPNGRKTEDNGFMISSTPYSVKLQNSMQESKLNLSVGNVLMKTKSENESDDINTNVSQVIYERETLHRSKIICSVMEEKSSKGERLRQLMQICNDINSPKEKWKPLTMIKTLEKETLKGTTLAVVPVCRRFCTYKMKGCNAILRQESVQRHEKRCSFKPVSCPTKMCSWNDSLNLLYHHICESHGEEIKWRNQYMYVLDRKNLADRTSIYYQIHKKIIYVLRLRFEYDKCIATIQHVPMVDSFLSLEKPVNVAMQMYAFCNKSREVSWKGVAQLYTDDEKQQNVALQLNIRNTEFVGLRLLVT